MDRCIFDNTPKQIMYDSLNELSMGRNRIDIAVAFLSELELKNNRRAAY